MSKYKLSLSAKHGLSRVLHYYADWRIGATEAEKRCHKQSDSILLTFDDYGTSDQIHNILSILAAKRVKAMFFLQESWVRQNQPLVDAISQAGHIVGNHTTNHPNLLKLSDEQVRQEIDNGMAGPWFRAPQGRYNARIRRIAAACGYSMCYWTIDSLDWRGSDVETMRHTILSELHPGAAILFHLHGRHTAELLPGLIDSIRERGFTLTGADETWTPTPQLAAAAVDFAVSD